MKPRAIQRASGVGCVGDRFGEVGVDGGVMMRLREVHGADRATLEAWWAARSALAEVTERRDGAHEADRLEQRQLLGHMTDRQRTWTGRALDNQAALRITPSARTHLRRMAWTRSRLAAAEGRAQERDVVHETGVADAGRLLAEATQSLMAQLPWAAELTGLPDRELRQLARSTS